VVVGVLGAVMGLGAEVQAVGVAAQVMRVLVQEILGGRFIVVG